MSQITSSGCTRTTGLHLHKNKNLSFRTVENAFNVFISFSYTKKHIILEINIVIAQIAILIMGSPSGTGFYVMRWVKYGGW